MRSPVDLSSEWKAGCPTHRRRASRRARGAARLRGVPNRRACRLHILWDSVPAGDATTAARSESVLLRLRHQGSAARCGGSILAHGEVPGSTAAPASSGAPWIVVVATDAIPNLQPDTIFRFICNDFETAWDAVARQRSGRSGRLGRGNFMFALQAMVLLEWASRLCAGTRSH